MIELFKDIASHFSLTWNIFVTIMCFSALGYMGKKGIDMLMKTLNDLNDKLDLKADHKDNEDCHKKIKQLASHHAHVVEPGAMITGKVVIE